jgi:hypothetical protein
MSGEPKLTVAGNNDLASEAARHAISSGLADPVYLWRTIEDPLVSTSPVIILADRDERSGFAQIALEAGLSVVSLPISDPDEQLGQAILDGRLNLISSLHGRPTMARLHEDCQSAAFGRLYGVFAAHRLPRNFAAECDAALQDLIVYVCSIIDSSLVRLSVTAAEGATFAITRFADDTIATIEVGALLPESADPNGELLVEVTGSDAVLRAEPERQAVIINGKDGFERQSWYDGPAEWLLNHALNMLGSDNVSQQRPLSNISKLLREAAQSSGAVSVR